MREYAKIWSWSPGKVIRFIAEILNIDSDESLSIPIKNSGTEAEQQRNIDGTAKQRKNSKLQLAIEHGQNRDGTEAERLYIRDKKREDILSDFFETLWKVYPAKDGKKKAQAHFSATVKNEADCQRVKTSLDNYLATLKRDHANGFNRQPKSGYRWFENWLDWEHQTPTAAATNDTRYDAIFAGA